MEAWPTTADSRRPVGAIPTALASRLRLTVAGASLGLAAAIAVSLSLAGSTAPIILAWLAVAGVLGGLIQRRSHIFPGAVAALGVAAVVDVVEGGLPIGVAPFLGGALLACAEFGYWSYELRANVRHSTIGVVRRTSVIVGLVLLGAGISALGVGLLEHVSAG